MRSAADPRAEMVSAKGLADEARQANWAPKGHSHRRAQARGHSAPHYVSVGLKARGPNVTAT